MESLDKYIELQKELFNYFGYFESWKVLPIDDAREYYWHLTGEGYGDEVIFSEQENDKDGGNLLDGTMDDVYKCSIYTQRHLRKWVYRGPEYTMIVVDTHTDGNKLLQIFANSKER